jgi:predicted nucleotidyltransferase
MKMSSICKKCNEFNEIVNLKEWLCLPCARVERKELAALMRAANKEYEDRLRQEIRFGKASVSYFMGAESA